MLNRKLLNFTFLLAMASICSECIAANWQQYDLFLPRPVTLYKFYSNNSALYFTASFYTCSKIVLGLLMGVITGTLLALTGELFPSIRSGLERYTMWSQTLPVPLLSPLLGLLVGYNIGSASVVTAIICFFPVYLGWEQGRLSLSQEVLLLAASYRPSRMRFIRDILLPAAAPHALIGIKGAVNLAVLGAVIAEFGAAGHGLGILMLRGIRELEPAKSWGAMFILVILAASMTAAVDRLQRSKHFSYMGGFHERSS